MKSSFSSKSVKMLTVIFILGVIIGGAVGLLSKGITVENPHTVTINTTLTTTSTVTVTQNETVSKGIFYGFIVDEVTKEPITNASVKFFKDLKDKLPTCVAKTNKSGIYSTTYELSSNLKFMLVEKEGYSSIQKEVSFSVVLTKNLFKIDTIGLLPETKPKQ